MIEVLVVEDSAVAQELLVHILSSDPEITVVGVAGDGKEALDFLASNKPHVVTMDIHMPRVNGFEATRRIMEEHPLPIVIVSANWNPEEVTMTFRAMEMGAVAVVEKPRGKGHPEYETMAKKLIQTVKSMSEVKVVRRLPRTRCQKPAPQPMLKKVEQDIGDIKLVAVGASTGGPVALKTVLSRLPADYPVSVLIVQHIAGGFLQGLIDWLAQDCSLPIRIATHGEHILPGNIYFAPDGSHMGVESDGRITLCKGEPENGSLPSVSHLFRSVADSYGKRAVGVLLTGMGRDGAKELKLMRDRGAVTIAQDKESSFIHGMPGEAIKIGAATYVLALLEIASTLERLAIKGQMYKNV